MKVIFKRALAPLAVSCAIFGVNAQTADSAGSYVKINTNGPIQQQQEYGAGLIVKYKDQIGPQGLQAKANAKAIAALSERLGVKAHHQRFTALGSQVLRFEKQQTVHALEALANRLKNDPMVEYAEVNRYMYPLAIPNDTHYNVQWHYSNPVSGINVEDAWDLADGTGVNVAVLDTGYTYHSDLQANIIGGYDFVSDSSRARDGNGRDSDASDEGDWNTYGECYTGSPARDSSWHGTHVAGTIAAVTNNSKGVAGVAFNANIVPVRVLAKCGGTTADIAEGIIWASGGYVAGVPANPNPAQVINMSLGGSGACSTTYQNAINSARNNGSVIVIASGNSNANVSDFTPGNCNGVISVAATNDTANRASYSNYGSLIDIAAPGGEGGAGGVASTMNNGTTTPSGETYAYNAGTSMAAPHVAGVAALMVSVNPDLTPDEIENTIKNTARSFPAGSSCNTSICGDGLLDALAAVEAVSGPIIVEPDELTNGVTKVISGATGSENRYTFYVPSGATTASITMSGGSGDGDLYVKYGSEPTSSSYDCRPYKNGNNEECIFNSPQAGTYHVMVKAYTSYSSVSLLGEHDAGSTPPPPPPPGSLENGVAKSISGAASEETFFTFEVPAGATNVSIDMSGGTGDADLYVRFGSKPTTSNYDCRPYKTGNNENCSFSTPQAGTYHVMVKGYSNYSGASLVATYESESAPIGGSFTQSDLTNSSRTWQHFTINVESGVSVLDVVMSGGSGDADLYVRHGSQPTTSSYDCRPYKGGNNESCSLANPAQGTWYISVYGYTQYSGVNLQADWQ